MLASSLLFFSPSFARHGPPVCLSAEGEEGCCCRLHNVHSQQLVARAPSSRMLSVVHPPHCALPCISFLLLLPRFARMNRSINHRLSTSLCRSCVVGGFLPAAAAAAASYSTSLSGSSPPLPPLPSRSNADFLHFAGMETAAACLTASSKSRFFSAAAAAAPND